MTNLLVGVILALGVVESGHNSRAYNSRTDAVGIYQITPVAVHEANRIVGFKCWSLHDRWNPQKSFAMCWTTLQFHYRRGCTDPILLAGKWYYPYRKAPRTYLNAVATAYNPSH